MLCQDCNEQVATELVEVGATRITVHRANTKPLDLKLTRALCGVCAKRRRDNVLTRAGMEHLTHNRNCPRYYGGTLCECNKLDAGHYDVGKEEGR